MRKPYLSGLAFLLLLFLFGSSFALTVEVKVNGEHEVSLPRSEARSAVYTVRVDPGAEAGRYAEWWLVAASPAGFWWFSLAGDWRFVQEISELKPTVRAEVSAVQETRVPLANLSQEAFVLGDFYLCLGVDFEVNGVISLENLVYDCARVEVLPDESELACSSVSGVWQGVLQGIDCRDQSIFTQFAITIEPSCDVTLSSGQNSRLDREGQQYVASLEDFLSGSCGEATLTLTPVSADTLRITVEFAEGGTLQGSLLRAD